MIINKSKKKNANRKKKQIGGEISLSNIIKIIFAFFCTLFPFSFCKSTNFTTKNSVILPKQNVHTRKLEKEFMHIQRLPKVEELYDDELEEDLSYNIPKQQMQMEEVLLSYDKLPKQQMQTTEEEDLSYDNIYAHNSREELDNEIFQNNSVSDNNNTMFPDLVSIYPNVAVSHVHGTNIFIINNLIIINQKFEQVLLKQKTENYNSFNSTKFKKKVSLIKKKINKIFDELFLNFNKISSNNDNNSIHKDNIHIKEYKKLTTNNMNQNIKNFMKINNANFENLLQVNNDELPYLLQKIIEKNKEFQKYLNKYFNDKKNLPTYFFYLHLNSNNQKTKKNTQF